MIWTDLKIMKIIIVTYFWWEDLYAVSNFFGSFNCLRLFLKTWLEIILTLASHFRHDSTLKNSKHMWHA